MCNVCCKEFKGWCKSFTRTELGLSALQALLLAVLVGFLVFLTSHFLACSAEQAKRPTGPTGIPTTHPVGPHVTTSSLGSSVAPVAPSQKITLYPGIASTTPTTVSSVTSSSDVECSWTPSKRTKANTRYYWSTSLSPRISHATPTILSTEQMSSHPEYNSDEYDDESGDSDSDAPQRYKDYVAALVKLKLPANLTYGCILTKVSQYWTVTAASCIESIEEVDSLDSFFITETYGEMTQGPNHEVVDVRIHPQYLGANRSFDLAALRSADQLASNTAHLLQLPTIAEYFLVALGERFTILGYGGYRTIDESPSGRQLRQVSTYTVSLAQCGDGGGETEAAGWWAPRHLTRGGALSERACGRCGASALCAGPLARSPPCAWCAGTPLLRAGRLFGVMADQRQCGLTCEPALYVNVAALRNWIRSVVD